MVDLERQASAKSTILANGKRQKGSRHVVFSDIMPYDNKDSDSMMSSQLTAQECVKKTRRGCFGCCAWACLVIFAFLIVFLIGGLIFLSFLKTSLPEVRIEKFSVPRLDLVSSDPKKDASVFSLDIEFRLNISNTNSKVEISYSGMSGKVNWGDNKLGEKKLHQEFSQEPKSVTSFKAVLDSQKASMAMEDGDNLKSRVKNKAMVVDVYLNGYLVYLTGGINLSGLPFAVKCIGVTQGLLDYGVQPKCDVKLFGM